MFKASLRNNHGETIHTTEHDNYLDALYWALDNRTKGRTWAVVWFVPNVSQGAHHG